MAEPDQPDLARGTGRPEEEADDAPPDFDDEEEDAASEESEGQAGNDSASSTSELEQLDTAGAELETGTARRARTPRLADLDTTGQSSDTPPGLPGAHDVSDESSSSSETGEAGRPPPSAQRVYRPPAASPNRRRGQSGLATTQTQAARRERAQVLGQLQQQYIVVEKNVQRLEARCAQSEQEAQEARQLAAARHDAQVSAEAVAEELRNEVRTLREGLLRAETGMREAQEAAAIAQDDAAALAARESTAVRDELTAELQRQRATSDAAAVARGRAEATASSAASRLEQSEGRCEALEKEVTRLNAATAAAQAGHENLRAELGTLVAGGGALSDGSETDMIVAVSLHTTSTRALAPPHRIVRVC